MQEAVADLPGVLPLLELMLMRDARRRPSIPDVLKRCAQHVPIPSPLAPPPLPPSFAALLLHFPSVLNVYVMLECLVSNRSALSAHRLAYCKCRPCAYAGLGTWHSLTVRMNSDSCLL